MREIKFRVWDKNLESMCTEPGYIQIDGYGNYSMFDDVNGEWQESGQNGADLVLMQFTGLKDSTKWEDATENPREGYTRETWGGVEIYEGDIVKVLFTDWASKEDSDTRTLEQYLDDKSELYVIGFHNGYFSMYYNGNEDAWYYIRGYNPHGFIKKIGNIYENPELLLKI